MVEVEKEWASKGVANSGLGFGIAGTALGLLNGGLGMLGGWNNHSVGCSENMPVTRYELGQESKIADLQSQIALRDANTYGDQRMWMDSLRTSEILCATRLCTTSEPRTVLPWLVRTLPLSRRSCPVTSRWRQSGVAAATIPLSPM